MKKLLMIFLSLAFITACSNDDDNGSGEDQILGVWFLADIENAESVGLNEDECNMQSSLDFQPNGTADAELFSLAEGTCTSESDSVSWSNIGDGKYRIELPFGDLGPQPGRVEFSGDSFTFYPDILSLANANITFEKR